MTASAVQPGRGVRPTRWWPGGLAAAGALVAGGLHAGALAPWAHGLAPWMPAVWQTLALAGLAGLLVPARSARQVAFLTWLYGTVWLVGATGWMFVSLHRYGGLPAWLSALAVGLLCAALSLYLGAAGWLWARGRSGSWWRDALAWGGAWLLAEWARAVVFTGFPWGASGYALVDTPLAGLAPWLGVYGVGALWATVVTASVWSLSRHAGVAARLSGLAAAAVLLFVGWGAGRLTFTVPVGTPLSVTLLQSNVPQDEKFAAERQGAMLLWHAEQLRSARTTLVVAPETAIPLLPFQLPEGYWSSLASAFPASGGRYALVGVPLGDFEHGYTNSIVGLGAGHAGAEPEAWGDPYRYDKHHLVPFGEFIPWGFRWFVRMMNMPLGDFTRGPLVAPSFAVRDQRVAPTVCYEDLFGEELAARFRDATHAPTILANVSNLAWFGESVAIHQHLQIARMRSLEFQLPTMRATNTGATVVIDHQGRVAARLPANTRGSLEATVQGMHGVTPFAWWAGRAGLWPAFVLALWLLLRRDRSRH